MRKIIIGLIIISAIFNGCNSDDASPRILSTFPQNGSVDVDSSISEITVTFSEEMMENSWSWTGGGDKYPQVIASIHYDETKTKCILPVKLESNKEYRIGINSKSHKNFKDKSGNPVTPFILQFKTK